ncbi:MAG TPA: leucyl aminopeptidase [Methylomusa anaerophila]|uniref:Probable cytosol aminopeptidase n=1 Tax=Methylomusa anaerophila TaxID=1930071 RepID=A0A348APV5_9FIRM|nr:leucyl aminopeptidase [Methylomusa anaerophila]BBB93103.1 cytosol aminopeptidase [Methylomusa anaerophila]HML87064.1 leucyl aminopeptidase [Methylomusa anaerophila]
MNIAIDIGPGTDVVCDTLILNIFEGELAANETTKILDTLDTLDTVLNDQFSEVIQEMPCCGKYGETTVIHTLGKLKTKKIILLGLGKKEDLTIDRIRSLTALVMRTAQKICSRSVASTIYGIGVAGITAHQAIHAMVEGAILGTYDFDYYKSERNNQTAIETFTIIGAEGQPNELTAIINTARIIAESVNYARDMINHPAHYMTPSKMASLACELAKRLDIEYLCLSREEMQCHGMGALLAVAQGSVEQPKIIILKYIGNPTSQDLTAFVGKGVTFDSGGISLKPSQNMDEMKRDMAGGAAVLGAMMAIGRLKPKSNIVGIIPCVENMPSGGAFRPGDIITAMSGKTIEIITTDAEGRLILADAITYAKKLGATRIVDLATLTGACVIALGTVTSAVIANDQEWCQMVLKAATKTGEKMWELPSFPEYTEQIKSSIADLKNSGGRPAGAITAGLFLEQFADKTPLVHIDIAGTAETDKDKGYNRKGGTGVGIRSLVQLAFDLEQ